MTNVSQETINALAQLRDAVAHSDQISNQLARAFNVLDNNGVFAAVDTATGYDLDAVASTTPVAGEPDPAEWGDTTRADMARHQGFTQDQARALFGDTEQADGLDASDTAAMKRLGARAFGLSDDADGRF